MCNLNSTLGKTPIGSPAALDVWLEQIEHEHKFSIRDDKFQDFDSQSDKPLPYSVNEYEKVHPLYTKSTEISWKNIPLPLKELVERIISYISFYEI